jgi:hypothetical protein
MTSVYERLKNLQITLPDVPPPVVDSYVAAFVPFVRTGNLIHLSGRLAKKNGKLWYGKLGRGWRQDARDPIMMRRPPRIEFRQSPGQELFVDNIYRPRCRECKLV